MIAHEDQSRTDAERITVGHVEEKRVGLERDHDVLRDEVDGESGECRRGHHERTPGKALQLQRLESGHATRVAASPHGLKRRSPFADEVSAERRS